MFTLDEAALPNGSRPLAYGAYGLRLINLNMPYWDCGETYP
jgi:hypothetical protein